LRIYIAASIRKERLCIVVKNTGQWVVPDPSVSLNTGLANLRRRLDLTYGESASLEIDRTEDGIIASIQIPATQATS
jgi:LytS/YehU family sensor histidine kinase